MQYRREIDGLRAVAVLPVILFHAGFTVFGGGYVGVDVFFVISGYLITSILISERENGTYSLWRFYERRARRILPALFLVMAVCVPIAWMRMPPYLFEDFARSMAFAALFVSNVHFWENTGYFALEAEMQPLLHTWSLAIEEQYYLLFPLILMALGAFRYWRFTWTFAVLAGLSLALAEWGWRNHPEENFFFTLSRFWELLAGSLCAVWLHKRKPIANELLAGLGLAMIVFSILVFDRLVPFPSLYTLVPVVGTMLIILFAAPPTLTARLLSLTPFVAIGLVSYSAYLWHQPLFAFARILSLHEPSHVLMGALALVSLVLAYLSWRFVEQPFRRAPTPLLPRRSGIFLASGAGIAAFVAFGLWGFAAEGFKGRLDRAMTPEFAAALDSIEARSDYNGCFPSSDHATRAAKLCDVYTPADPKRVFGVIGDSHAMSLIAGLAPLSDRHDAIIRAATVPACPPLIGVTTTQRSGGSAFCRQSVEDQLQGFIDTNTEIVFLVGRWSLYATDGYDGPNPNFALAVDGQTVSRDPKSALEALKTGLETTLKRLTDAGIQIVLVAQVPEQKVLPRQVVERALLLGQRPTEVDAFIKESFVTKTDHLRLQERANSTLQAQNGDKVTVIALDPVFADGDRFAWFKDGVSLYVDHDHLSVEGATRAGAFLAQEIDALVEPR